MVAGLLLVLAAGVGLASLGGDSDPPGGPSQRRPRTTATERQGDPITMRSVPGTTAVANAGLIDYGEPPPTIRIELTPGGPRYQLLLFQTLDSVRSVEGIPPSAMLVLGGGPSGDLSTGEENEEGYTRHYGIGLPANFRKFRYFGIARVTGTKRTLVALRRGQAAVGSALARAKGGRRPPSRWLSRRPGAQRGASRRPGS